MKTEIIKGAEEVLRKIVEMVMGVESLIINHELTTRGILFELDHSDKDQLKFVVGKKGRNIKQLRRIMNVWARRNKCRIEIFVPSNKQSVINQNN